jgi:hypothetical protein
MIMHTHLGNSTNNPSSLSRHKDIWHQKWDINKPDYAHTQALIQHSLAARLLNLVMLNKKINTWDELSHWERTWEDIKDLAAWIVVNFATSCAADNTREVNDDYLRHGILFIQESGHTHF